MQVVEDPLRALSNEPSASSFGFVKPLLETPRTVSFVSEEQISLFGVSAVEDLMRVVPGTYTTTRYGLQGGINVRGVSADMYYRGMKRLNMQGHVRTVLSAMDGIEVVKGPPSPIYGMGKIGGYTNLTPKSSRAKTGTYLPGTTGFYQIAGGAYGRMEGQLGVGGPVSLGNKQAGFYGFVMLEDSDTYIKQVGVQQRFGQITMSVENFVGPFRLEAGGQAQNSITSGAYMNRVTQALVDNGDYVSGQPMVNMDVNGDGQIGYVEQYQASPVRGNLSAGNLTLSQRYTWQRDTAGNLVPFDSFAAVPGIPATMLAYLQAHPEINCRAAEVMRAMPAGGPLPTSGQLPVGFALDPCTVQTVKVDYRRNGAFEREQNAVQRLGYIDLIYDVNPDFTVKNQMFYDNIDSFKDSWLPYGENQYIKTIENKFTVTKRIPDSWLPDFVRINSLASANYRRTSGWIRSSGGDFDYRQDVMFNDGISYPEHQVLDAVQQRHLCDRHARQQRPLVHVRRTRRRPHVRHRPVPQDEPAAGRALRQVACHGAGRAAVQSAGRHVRQSRPLHRAGAGGQRQRFGQVLEREHFVPVAVRLPAVFHDGEFQPDARRLQQHRAGERGARRAHRRSRAARRPVSRAASSAANSSGPRPPTSRRAPTWPRRTTRLPEPKCPARWRAASRPRSSGSRSAISIYRSTACGRSLNTPSTPRRTSK